jgi:hypothetical protein
LNRITACMNSHVLKIGFKARFHERSHLIGQRATPAFAGIQPMF